MLALLSEILAFVQVSRLSDYRFYFSSISQVETAATLTLVFVLFGFLLSLVGMILGIVGTALRNRKKGMAITGMVLSIIEFLFSIGIFTYVVEGLTRFL